MNWRVLTMVSVALNVLLVAFIFKARSAGKTQVTDVDLSTTVVRTNMATRTVTNFIQSPVPTGSLEVVWPTWDEISGDDMSEYRDNLVALECPPDTLRKILTTELDRVHFRERKTVVAPVSSMFWDLIARHGFDDEISEFKEVGEELDKIEKKFRSIQNELLQSLPAQRAATRPPTSPQYEHLGLDRQSQLIALDSEYRAQRDAITQNKEYRDEQNKITKEGREKLNQLSKMHNARLREFMSDDEFLEYRLKVSGSANWAVQLRGFEPTEEELRQIAEWKLSLSEQHPRTGRNDPAAREKNEARRAAQNELEDEIKGLIGDERYVAFDRARDGAYQEFYDLTDVFGLSENVAVDAWNVRRSAVSAAEQIRNNEQLSPVEKRDALRAVQLETRAALQGVLGDEYLQAYERKAGDWMEGLSRIRN